MARALAILMLVSLLPMQPSAAASGVRALTIDSDPGNYVGQGAHHVLTPANATMAAFANGSRISIEAEGEAKWHATVWPPNGEELAPGHYTTSDDPTDTTLALLDVFGDGRACDHTGEMTVHEVGFDGAGDLNVLALTYRLTCQSNTPPPNDMYGEIRWDSTLGYSASTLSSTSLDLGKGIVGTEGPSGSITLTNHGSTPLTVALPSLSGDGQHFSPGGSCIGAAIAPGGACELIATFAPQGAGNLSSTLTVDAGAPRGPRPISLTGHASWKTKATTVLKRHFGKQGKFKLFRFGSKILQIGRARPDLGGRELEFVAQRKARRWKTAAEGTFRINSKGIARAVFVGRPGKYRTFVYYGGDDQHTFARSRFAFFKIVV